MYKKAVWLVVVVVAVVALAGCKSVAPPDDAVAFEVPGEEFPPVPEVDVTGLEGYVASVGLAGVISVVVEILKQLKAIPDGQAGRWATIANIVVFAGLVIAGVFGVDYSGDAAKDIYDLLHRVGQAVLTVISSPVFFQILRKAEVFRKQPV